MLAHAGVVPGFAHDVAEDPAQIGSHAAQRPVGALELLGVGVALMGDQRVFADARVGLAQATPCFLASHTSFSRARCMSLASVGNATALGCTVVSTITLEKSDGLAAPVRVATFRLSWISATSFSSPMRWRHRVIDERSNGSL